MRPQSAVEGRSSCKPSQWRFVTDSEETPTAPSDSTPYEVLMLCLTLACEDR
ncbi:hypothetical protein OG301_31115 [Streptomyces platensis]|uniref:hypothetical protein n=1 Tax=Streptomyces platensis TaxID=58346 RepID=UPI002ED5E07E|nr:hypothetical protein OG301_31115 [Streptomyces platensis]